MVRHMTDHNHKLNFNHIKILHSERDWNKRLVSEMLYISFKILDSLYYIIMSKMVGFLFLVNFFLIFFLTVKKSVIIF